MNFEIRLANCDNVSESVALEAIANNHKEHCLRHHTGLEMTLSYLKRCILVCLLFSTNLNLNAQTKPTSDSPVAEQIQYDLDVARDAVKTKMAYSLPEGAVDSLHELLSKQAKTAKNRFDHLRVLEAFVYGLGDHHSHLGTNDSDSPRLVPSSATVWVEMRGDNLVVTQVRPGSAARRSGLCEGMIVDNIDGLVPGELKPPNAGPDELMRGFAARVALAGKQNQDAVLVAHPHGGSAITVVVALSTNRPKEPVSLSWPRENVALIRINNQLGESNLPSAFKVAMQDALKARCIIFDLRDTPSGGDSVIAKPLMSWFVDGTKGYQIHKRAEKRWTESVVGHSNRFAGQLIVLADHWTGSMGEGMTIGLRAAAGAKYVGTPMAGLRGAIEGTDLPFLNAQIRFPVEQLFEVHGNPREAAMPDVLVTEVELAAANGDEDVILKRALELVR